jgi:hypothetical protein
MLDATSISAMVNRYKGKCAGCGAKVAEGDGIYANGSTWCAEALVSMEFGYICPNKIGAVANIAKLHEESKVREAKIEEINKVRAAELEAKRIAYAESDEGKAEVAARKAKAAELKKNGLKICRRCGGAGESDKWTYTGRTCYGCGGSGYITPEVL